MSVNELPKFYTVPPTDNETGGEDNNLSKFRRIKKWAKGVRDQWLLFQQNADTQPEKFQQLSDHELRAMTQIDQLLEKGIIGPEEADKRRRQWRNLHPPMQ